MFTPRPNDNDLSALFHPTGPDATTVSVVCISDTHNTRPDAPTGDILIHAGDMTQSGSFTEIQATLDWLNVQPHAHKIVVGGNHDVLLDSTRDAQHVAGAEVARDERERLDWGGIIYLEGRGTTVQVRCGNGEMREVKVYGSPRSVRNGNWAFQYPRGDDGWGSAGGQRGDNGEIPEDVDILITHGPPKAHLDLMGLGCEHLLREVWRVKPKLHVFGHVHAGYGLEVLRFGALQEAYEGVVVSRGGMKGLGQLVMGLVLSFLRVGGAGGRETLLVNAAVVGGLRDEQSRRARKVYI
ncbi:Metallo-dependent phosphatase-like protein [Bombardia bombarda]|uniref:Metallo-dependent phosphatase-like protein n=1 Tax=Bombardia bombarda TaxID=252184 RepID=A0AA39WGP9_9PEZI|nr:Metallo-dependent phosphatase-like protein [Bombardia bombarda]